MIKHSYKKLKIWQKAIEIAKEAYFLSKSFPKEEIYGLIGQIRRSAVSVPSNIAEGSQRKSDKEFANFILIAKGSLVEMETQFILAESFGYLSNDQLEEIGQKINEVDKMLFAFHKGLTANSYQLTAQE